MAHLTKNYTDTINAISEIIEEDLSGGVPDTQPDLDDFYQKLKTMSMGVVSAGIGRGFNVVHPLREGIAGTVKWVSGVLGPAPLDNMTPIVRTTAEVTAYPGLNENVAPGHLNKTISLARAQGNIFLPIEYMQADALDATLTSSIAEIIRGAAENILLSEIHQFYRITNTAATGFARIAVGSTPTYANANATDDEITFIVGEGSVRQFYTGLLFDVHNPTGPARRNATGAIVVVNVRYIPDTTNDTGGWGQVVATSVSGEDLNMISITAGDVITRRDSVNNGPLGPEDWLINTGAAIFGIDVDVFQQFQSILATVSGVATGTVLSKYFARFFRAYGMANMPDTIVTSMGVTNANIENDDSLGRYQLGQTQVFSEGYKMGEPQFVFNGRNVGWNVSAFMPSTSDMTATSQTGGLMWALKTRDQNIRRYIPPKPGAFDTAGSPIPNEVMFPFPVNGPMGIFKPRHDTAGDTVNFLEAPFDRWMAIAPVWLPGIRLDSLVEST